MNLLLTEPEIVVLNWLYSHKIAFIPHGKIMGGSSEPGGAIVDYLLTDFNIIIRIQSYWHTIEGTEAKDRLQRIALENQGFIVVDIWETDLKVNPDEVMRMALQGRSKEH